MKLWHAGLIGLVISSFPLSLVASVNVTDNGVFTCDAALRSAIVDAAGNRTQRLWRKYPLTAEQIRAKLGASETSKVRRQPLRRAMIRFFASVAGEVQIVNDNYFPALWMNDETVYLAQIYVDSLHQDLEKMSAEKQKAVAVAKERVEAWKRDFLLREEVVGEGDAKDRPIIARTVYEYEVERKIELAISYAFHAKFLKEIEDDITNSRWGENSYRGDRPIQVQLPVYQDGSWIEQHLSASDVYQLRIMAKQKQQMAEETLGALLADHPYSLQAFIYKIKGRRNNSSDNEKARINHKGVETDALSLKELEDRYTNRNYRIHILHTLISDEIGTYRSKKDPVPEQLLTAHQELYDLYQSPTVVWSRLDLQQRRYRRQLFSELASFSRLWPALVEKWDKIRNNKTFKQFVSEDKLRVLGANTWIAATSGSSLRLLGGLGGLGGILTLVGGIFTPDGEVDKEALKALAEDEQVAGVVEEVRSRVVEEIEDLVNAGTDEASPQLELSLQGAYDMQRKALDELEAMLQEREAKVTELEKRLQEPDLDGGTVKAVKSELEVARILRDDLAQRVESDRKSLARLQDLLKNGRST